MAVYQERALERIKKSFRRLGTLIEKGILDDYKEADTRKIVSSILVDSLGWDEFENITAEQMIGSRYADYVIKKDRDQLFVVEVKAIGFKLKDTHLNQARLYAIDEGIEWVLLTNGDTWKVYRMVYEDKIPVAKHVFSVTLSDKEMKPAEKADLLYLLSEEAARKNEIDDYYQRRVALSGANLADHILSDDVLNKIRISIKNATGQKLTNSEIAGALMKRLFREEILTCDHEKAIKRITRSEHQAKTSQQTADQ